MHGESNNYLLSGDLGFESSNYLLCGDLCVVKVITVCILCLCWLLVRMFVNARLLLSVKYSESVFLAEKWKSGVFLASVFFMRNLCVLFLTDRSKQA